MNGVGVGDPMVRAREASGGTSGTAPSKRGAGGCDRAKRRSAGRPAYAGSPGSYGTEIEVGDATAPAALG